jgi:hypothetical protein
MNGLMRPFDDSETAVGVRKDYLVELGINISLRRVVQRHGTKAAVFVLRHCAEFGTADSRRVLKHFVEDRLQLAAG